MNIRLNKNGITLIALIITIIVLVIIASTTIAVIQNDGSLFTAAEKSTFVKGIKELEEQIDVYKSDKMLGSYTGREIDYSVLVPDSLSKYVAVNANGEIIYIGDPNSKEASWAQEMGIIVNEPEPDERTKFIIQVEELREKIKTYAGTDYSSLIPESLKDYIDVWYGGQIIFIGDKNSEQATWAQEIGIIVDEKTKFSILIEELREKIKTHVGTDYSSLIPESLKDYIDVWYGGQIVFIGDKNSEQATWAQEIGVIVDEKTKFTIQIEELREKIETYVGSDYSSLIPESLEDYIDVWNDGELVFIGDKNSEQATWAEELDIMEKQEYQIKAVLGELVDLAKAYKKQSGSSTSYNELALQYIRRNKYTGGNWDTVAGTVDTSFVTYVNNNKTQSLDIGSIKDPNTGETIDFVHGMASVNAYLETAPSDNILAQYSCWAGDLCTLTTEIYNYYKSNSPTSAQLKTYTEQKLCGSSTFSLEDMLADADAVNIWQLIKSGKDLDDAIYGYYYGSGTSTCANRYQKFGNYVSSLSSSIYNACQYYLGVTGGTFSWGRIYANQLISNRSSIPSVVFTTVSTVFSEYISARM